MGGTAYFDNAATTFPKPEEVYDFADQFYRTRGGNAGRGNNSLAAAAKGVAEQAKENLRKLYRCPARRIVFTSSATEALNRVILGSSLGPGDNVYITPFEHNAVTRPLNHLVLSAGVSLCQLAFNRETLLPELEQIEKQFSSIRPKMVVMTHASNVCGAVVPVLEVAKLAKAYGALVAVDMSQTCGLVPLDLATELVDFAVFAGHKTLYAPFGVGGFMCLQSSKLEPVLFGGNGINSIEQEMPSDIVQMSEIGSQNTYAMAGLKASTDWLISRSFEDIRAAESNALDTLLSTLREYENVHILCDEMQCERIGVVSALFDGFSPDEVEMILGKGGVAVRSGLHCAPYAHQFLGTLPAGTVRFSVSALTRQEDFLLLGEWLERVHDEA